jgi:hypothetical protein
MKRERKEGAHPPTLQLARHAHNIKENLVKPVKLIN